jgi:hypothetical protein
MQHPGIESPTPDKGSYRAPAQCQRVSLWLPRISIIFLRLVAIANLMAAWHALRAIPSPPVSLTPGRRPFSHGRLWKAFVMFVTLCLLTPDTGYHPLLPQWMTAAPIPLE